MLKHRVNYTKICRGAFSLAEMMIVLLIISFLVLALPPIVHKKFAKRVTRGEHGRYECWKDPTNGKLMEYYATEKAGVIRGGTVANPTGVEVTECSFKPREMAPNAEYFAFQVIGGGAGGSYPIYDAADKQFKDPAHVDTASVKLLHGVRSASKCCTEYDVDSNGRCKTAEDSVNGGFEKYCADYGASLAYYANKIETRDWVKKYWVPVENTQALEICSGSGFTGPATMAKVGETPDHTFHYGGRGGSGKCYKIDAGKLKLDKDYRFNISYLTKSNDSYWTSEDNGHHKNNKFYRSWVYHKIVSWEFPEVGNSMFDADLLSPAGHWAHPEIPLGIEGTEDCEVAGKETGDKILNKPILDSDNCRNVDYTGNYIIAKYYGSGLPEDAPSCKINPGENGQGGRSDNGGFIDESMADGPAAVWKYQNADSSKGADATAECTADWTEIGNHQYVAYGMAFGGGNKVVNRPNAYWGVVQENMNNTVINSLNSQLSFFFPATIDVSYQFGYDTPTFGYAGMPGESLSTFLSGLPDELTFDIGAGGAAATASSLATAGMDTIVKSKDDSSNTKVLLTAKGGLARPGGEAAPKIRLFGIDTCKSLLDEGAKPDGCLDRGVALYDDAPMRFALDSGFYTILELDTSSKTPSAIYSLYGKIPTEPNSNYALMPGTAGDGGYNIIKNADGTENLLYSGYGDAQKNASTVLTVHDEQTEQDVTLPAFKLSEGLRREHVSYTYPSKYKCYRRYDALNNATGTELGDSETICAPSRGYPGAVVIVW